MLYTADEHKSRLHLIMLSPSTGGSNVLMQDKLSSKLYFYVNRPIAAVMHNPVIFAKLLESVPEIRRTNYAVMSIEAFCAKAAPDTVVPQEDDGIVLQFRLMPGVENPTEAVAKVAKLIAEFFGVSLWDTKLSGHYGQGAPESYETLNLMDFPSQYLDDHAFVAASSRELVTS